jgi:hypothetical protein
MRGCVLLSLLSVFSSYSALARPNSGGLVYDTTKARPFADARAELLKRLQAIPGPHLVILKYGPDHDTGQEWVYNRASIDSARVVWARSMGEHENAQLRTYFKARTIWQYEPDFGRLEQLPSARPLLLRPR